MSDTFRLIRSPTLSLCVGASGADEAAIGAKRRLSRASGRNFPGTECVSELEKMIQDQYFQDQYFRET